MRTFQGNNYKNVVPQREPEGNYNIAEQLYRYCIVRLNKTFLLFFEMSYLAYSHKLIKINITEREQF